jgi:putative transposase
MRKSRFSAEEMVAIVREAAKDAVADVARRRGVSVQTIYVWRRRFGQLEASDVKRLKALEA